MGGDIVLQLLPFMIIAIPFAIANFFLANRIERSGSLFAVLTFIPVVGYIATIYLFYKGLFYAIDKAKISFKS